jgi:tRNA(fMet)-specific endonuclease VapC
LPSSTRASSEPTPPAAPRNAGALVENYLSRLPVVSFDAAVAREYARMRAKLLPMGRTIAVHDLQIAVTALVIGFQVATRGTRSFPRIPDLKIEQW